MFFLNQRVQNVVLVGLYEIRIGGQKSGMVTREHGKINTIEGQKCQKWENVGDLYSHGAVG